MIDVPLFSIIMTSYNYEKYIFHAIESVISQTYQNWELIIVDDCSSDNSWQIIQGFSDKRIKAIQQKENLGACTAYNLALSMTQGDYIASLDSDDMFHPTKLERQSNFFLDNPEVDICGSYITEIDCDGCILDGKTPHADWFNVLIDLNDPASWIKENRLCHSSVVVRAELHKLLGGMNGQLTYTPDWEFWIRAFSIGSKFSVICEPLTLYRNHGLNITHKNKVAMLKEHSHTFVEYLLPLLIKSNHSRLIDDFLIWLFSSPEIISSRELAGFLASCFFSGGKNSDIGENFIGLLISQRESIVMLNEQISALLSGKEWLEKQYFFQKSEIERLNAAFESKSLWRYIHDKFKN